MIQAFGGGFVIGFLGTAAPRIIGAPRLTGWELIALLALHLSGSFCHLLGHNFPGDLLFLILLISFAAALGVRLVWFKIDPPPPPLLLAAVGIACGMAGTLLWLNPTWMTTMELHRLARLLLYQGFLLGPVMGVGIYLFPRLLGHNFGEPTTNAEARRRWRDSTLVALSMPLSFVLEIWWNEAAGMLLRATAFGFALLQIRWSPADRTKKVGTLANALRFWCLPLAFAGLTLPVFADTRHVAIHHLLFVSGFGLLCLIVGSRVLFGHSGPVERFENRSWMARLIVGTVILAATTRVSADYLPRVTISHYEYAAGSWAVGALIWLIWHAGRLFTIDRND
jgi:uncharacterized protein involved in response to NO